MGCASSKCRKEKTRLRAAIHQLEEDVRQMRCKREQEGARAHAAMEWKEAEWKEERRRLRDECEALKRKLEEEEEVWRRRAVDASDEKAGEGWFLVEMMSVEQARREEAVEKWKQLYLAIKTELDDLIRRTGHGGDNFLRWGTEEEVIDVLQRELRAREETLQALKLRLVAMEKEGAKRDREIDILRQSLRILNGTKCVYAKQNVSRKKVP